ncbi:Tricorn protease N-terminal domain-containing protein [Vibrio azureus]|uniref:DUF5050 domain-containing protein n=1 Tax=Vibrio azureus NBRC 104587 TaxID=1219077 RepID=U3BZP6_9VIBR|nr:WD40 repeat domain-containing protein [Vibrio azureus]AUI87804.1 Tricorn protease N-terminal domain-containing protein [Vibrio azureus]GAD74759.1 hypothetical protein VAZ01S_015_00030 [Vibrio azureus NBRC 104587]
MKNLFSLFIAVFALTACTDDGRIYVGDHNYYTIEPTTIAKSPSTTYQPGEFPRYSIFRAKEWPREDLSNANSYDLPRVQFTWANLADESDPMYTKYEGKVKIWSMKTDGTDLRLVTDLPYLGKRHSTRYKTSRSPNNRYVAFNSGTDVKVFDLKEQQMTDLPHRLNGIPAFLWAEDSSYLYYRTGLAGRTVYKWDVQSGKVEKTNTKIPVTGFIRDGLIYYVGTVGVGIDNEETGESLKLVNWGKDLPINRAKTKYQAISPEGDKVWASGSGNVFYVDFKQGQVKPREGAMQYAIGLNSRYSLTNYNVMHMSVQKNDTKQTWEWQALRNSGTRDPAIVYNISANKGNWFKEGY